MRTIFAYIAIALACLTAQAATTTNRDITTVPAIESPAGTVLMVDNTVAGHIGQAGLTNVLNSLKSLPNWPPTPLTNPSAYQASSIVLSNLVGTGALTNADQVNNGFKPSLHIAWFSDTQYLETNGTIYQNYVRWIATNQLAAPDMIFHTGDVVDDATTLTNWIAPSNAFHLLTNLVTVPVIVTAGNHDYDSGPNLFASLTNFNATFPQDFFMNQPGWSGGFKTTGHSENGYWLMTNYGTPMIVTWTECFPSTNTLDWLSGVLDTHSNHAAIFLTHAFVYKDDSILTPIDPYGASYYKRTYSAPATLTDPSDMWDYCLRWRSNLRMVLSGHVFIPWVAKTTLIGEYANRVQAALCNPQMDPANFWTRFIDISPANTVRHRTFSGFLGVNNFVYYPDGQFEHPWIQGASSMAVRQRVTIEADTPNGPELMLSSALTSTGTNLVRFSFGVPTNGSVLEMRSGSRMEAVSNTLIATMGASGVQFNVPVLGVTATNRDGLFARFNLDEMTGTNVWDDSGSGWRGTFKTLASTFPALIGGPSPYPGSHVYFNGGCYIEIPTNAAAQIQTNFSMGIYMRSLTNSRTSSVIASCHNSAQNCRWSLAFKDNNGGLIALLKADGSNRYQVDTPDLFLKDTNWHHLALVYNGSTVSIWVDGTNAASTNAVGAVSAGSYNMVLGTYWGQVPPNTFVSVNYMFEGWMDDFRMWNRALSQQEISCFTNRAAVANKWSTVYGF